MTQEEENQLREEKRALQEQVRLLQEQIDTLQETKRLQGEVIRALQQQLGLQEQEIGLLKQQVQELQERLKKDSHNSHLPPSSDRFGRQPRSLRKKSGKKAGGQEGHAGNTLHLSETPDEVIVHAVERCGACQRDLRGVASQAVERRQVVDMPRHSIGDHGTPGGSESLSGVQAGDAGRLPAGGASAGAVWASLRSGGRLSGAAAVTAV